MKKVIVLICFLFILVGCGEKKEEDIMINKVSCNEAKDLIKEGAILIDVREIDEYNENHLDDAINISYTVIGDKISEYVTDFNTKIIVYCKSGGRSNKAANTLKNKGYKNIYDLGSINNCINN